MSGGFIAAILLVALCILCIAANIAFKSRRPITPRDDAFDEIAHGDWPAIPECVEPLHRSGDRP